MAQQSFTPGSRIAGTEAGTNVTVGTALANYVIWNKTQGYVDGVISGAGSQNYTVRSQAISPQWNNRITVEENGTNDIVIRYSLAPGEGMGFVASASAAAGRFTMDSCEMKHTAVGSRRAAVNSQAEFEQVFLSVVT